MSRLKDAIDRIKILQCPTGDVEKRIAEILEDYNVAKLSQISVKRDHRFDTDGAEGYNAKIAGRKGQSIVVLAKSGYDDYVASVVDAYLY